MINFIRALRTAASERFILRDGLDDIAAVDIHYLADATVQATLIIFERGENVDAQIPVLLGHIDEMLLPEVSLDDKQLFFTVVVGRVLGSYEPEPHQRINTSPE